MTDGLKPCPFCGNTTSDHKHGDECWFRVIYKSKQERENSWNTRPIEDKLRAQLAERDALIERLVEAGDLALHSCEIAPVWSELRRERVKNAQALIAEIEKEKSRRKVNDERD